MTSINTESNNIEDCYEQANMLSEQNDYEEAIEAYNKVIELNPNHVGAYYNKGYALEGLGYTSGDINKFLEAIKAYDRVIEIKPDYAIAYQVKGILWKTIGDIESRKAFDKFYKLRPDMRKLSNAKFYSATDENFQALNIRKEVNLKDSMCDVK